MLLKGITTPMLGQQRPTRGQLHVVNVATPSKNPSSRLAKRSKVEIIKEKSDYLRHPLMEELVNDATFITEDSVQLMKFHGSYQQDHREKRAFGQGKAYCFMMRTRQPAGVVPNRLYLVMDDLADQVRDWGGCTRRCEIVAESACKPPERELGFARPSPAHHDHTFAYMQLNWGC